MDNAYGNSHCSQPVKVLYVVGKDGKFQKLVELQFDMKIKTFQADMGGEYLPFVSYLSNIGVHVRFSCPYTHQQNGVPERKHRNIVEMGLTLVAHASLPFKFWFAAFSTAMLLINNLLSALLDFASPFERLVQKKPNYIQSIWEFLLSISKKLLQTQV